MYNNKKVITFDTQDRFDDKIDKITSMINKLTAQGNNQNKQFKPKIYQGQRREQTRNYYDQGNCQNRYRSNIGDKTAFRGRGYYGQNYRAWPQYVNTYRNHFRRENYKGGQNCTGQNFRGEYRGNYRNDNLEEVEVSLGKDNIQVSLQGMIEAVAVGLDQG